jgi:hypothetical protein
MNDRLSGRPNSLLPGGWVMAFFTVLFEIVLRKLAGNHNQTSLRG